MKNGEIVIINFPFTDLSSKKLRPALILSNEKFNKSKNCILMGIYSKEGLEGFSVKLEQKDLISGKIKKTSFLRFQNIFTLEKRLIIKRIAEIKSDKLDQILDKFQKYISN